MKQLKTETEVFSHILEIYDKSENFAECYLSIYMCNAVMLLHDYEKINKHLEKKCLDTLSYHRPKDNHWMTKSVLYAGDGVGCWLNSITAKFENREKEFLQLKVRFLKELINTINNGHKN